MLNVFRSLPNWVRLALIFPVLFMNGFLIAILLKYLEPLISFLITASLCAFLLELAVKGLEKSGMRRGFAIITILFSTIFVVGLLAFILIPLIAEQLAGLLESAPRWFEQATLELDRFSENPLFGRLSIDIDKLIRELSQQISKLLESFGSRILDILLNTITSVVNTLLVLILTIFLLIGGEKFWDGIFSWLPSPWDKKIRQYTRRTFKDYFFSRLILIGVASLVRAIVFILLGVPYSILFAFGIGIASFIPFVAGVVILVSTVILVFKDIALGIKLFLAAFIIDQITDNVIAPRWMGDLIGLNPIWLIIALFIGAKMGGVLGLLLAVPIASVVKQVVDDLRAGVTPEIPPEIVVDEEETQLNP